jgi:hypothetical protein
MFRVEIFTPAFIPNLAGLCANKAVLIKNAVIKKLIFFIINGFLGYMQKKGRKICIGSYFAAIIYF